MTLALKRCEIKNRKGGDKHNKATVIELLRMDMNRLAHEARRSRLVPIRLFRHTRRRRFRICIGLINCRREKLLLLW